MKTTLEKFVLNIYNMNKNAIKHFLLISLMHLTWFGLFVSCATKDKTEKIKGWNILSNHLENAEMVIEKSKEYGINHLQLSHHIVMDLRHVKNPERAKMVNHLTNKAHEAGIQEVTVWDHALYHLDYYPNEFKTGPDSTINLDNPEFWKWIKSDYRSMLDRVPDIDGIILTFIETGAHVEDQHSEKMITEEEKLAAMVDTLASVIINERNLRLYVRTFIYTRSELESMLKCINLVENPKLRVMTKEVPHDFFLTHPVSRFVEDIKFPVIIEFDAAHEYHGQSITASMYPQKHLERWKYYQTLPNVIGYVARTDRYGNTTIIGNPAEVNLFAIDRGFGESDLSIDQMVDSFIVQRYGTAAVVNLGQAFNNMLDVTTSTMYTLGLHNNSHSRFDLDNRSTFTRHVSGKWLDNPVTFIEHGVNKEFHYWKDIVNHLSPAWYKSDDNLLSVESPWVLDSGWVQPVELMNEEYLKYILTEKEYGVDLADESLDLVKNSKELLDDPADYDSLYHIFNRTLITARLYEAGAKAYYGYRVYSKGDEYQTGYVKQMVAEGISDLNKTIAEIENYPKPGPVGQFNWGKDALRARELVDLITKTGWDAYGGVIFKE